MERRYWGDKKINSIFYSYSDGICTVEVYFFLTQNRIPSTTAFFRITGGEKIHLNHGAVVSFRMENPTQVRVSVITTLSLI